MSLVLQLRSERAKLNESLQALAKLESGGETLSAEQLAQFTSLEAQFNVLTDKISRAEQAERMAAASAVPVNESAQGRTGPPPGYISRLRVQLRRQVCAWLRWFDCWPLPLVISSRRRKWQSKGGYSTDVAMALNTVTPGAGGVLVPQNFATEIIEALRPMSIVRKMGARSLPLNNGNLTQPVLPATPS